MSLNKTMTKQSTKPNKYTRGGGRKKTHTKKLFALQEGKSNVALNTTSRSHVY